MSQGMLGTLKLSDVRGPMGDLEERLAGPNGKAWLVSLRRFLRRDREPFAELAPGEEPRTIFERWRPVDAVTVDVNLDAELAPWSGSNKLDWIAPGQTEGWVRVHRDGDVLRVDGREIRLFQLPEQSGNRTSLGTMDFRRRIGELDPVHPNILSAIYENLHLIPFEAWTRDDGGYHRSFASWSHGFIGYESHPCVRSLQYFRGVWKQSTRNIDGQFDWHDVALVLANPSGPT